LGQDPGPDLDRHQMESRTRIGINVRFCVLLPVYKYLRKTSKTAEQAGLSLSTIFFSWLSLHFEFINITSNRVNEIND
jgi:hypothetical protein